MISKAVKTMSCCLNTAIERTMKTMRFRLNTAIITAAITAGSYAERMKFSSMLIFFAAFLSSAPWMVWKAALGGGRWLDT